MNISNQNIFKKGTKEFDNDKLRASMILENRFEFEF